MQEICHPPPSPFYPPQSTFFGKLHINVLVQIKVFKNIPFLTGKIQSRILIIIINYIKKSIPVMGCKNISKDIKNNLLN